MASSYSACLYMCQVCATEQSVCIQTIQDHLSHDLIVNEITKTYRKGTRLGKYVVEFPVSTPCRHCNNNITVNVRGEATMKAWLPFQPTSDYPRQRQMEQISFLILPDYEISLILRDHSLATPSEPSPPQEFQRNHLCPLEQPPHNNHSPTSEPPQEFQHPPEHHSPSRKSDQDIKIGTWNVEGFDVNEIEKGVQEAELDICGLCADQQNLGVGMARVGIAIGEKLQNSMIDGGREGIYIVWIRIEVGNAMWLIVCAHADDTDTFWTALNTFLKDYGKLHPGDYIVLVGDLKARVEKDSLYFKFKMESDNGVVVQGQKLKETCVRHNLQILLTHYVEEHNKTNYICTDWRLSRTNKNEVGRDGGPVGLELKREGLPVARHVY